jgi:cytochrome c oxidase assembly protein subunit 15
VSNVSQRREPTHGGDILTLGFATTVAMWAVGYFGRLPGVQAPIWVLMPLMFGLLILGGRQAGRWTGRGWRGGLWVGLLASTLNLLVLGSLLAAGDAPNRVVPSALLWVPGSLLMGAFFSAMGAVENGRRTARPPFAWPAAFAFVAAGATLLLLAAGGVVTGQQAGLAVVDWPNSFGSNMFLYPLSRMTGGVFYEHAHRLLGSLVGLTTLVLAVFLWRTDERRGVKLLAGAALLLVIVQGVLGGLRVTGRFTGSMDPAHTAPNLTLAIVHGVTGQVFLGVLIALAAMSTRGWRAARPKIFADARTDALLSRAVVIVVIVQLVLGAILRHLSHGLLLHITMAVAVAVVGLLAGLRAWGEHPDVPRLQGLGRALMILLGLQICLGLAALWATGLTAAAGAPALADVILTTLHQSTGAVILACSVLLALWNTRLLRAAA